MARLLSTLVMCALLCSAPAPARSQIPATPEAKLAALAELKALNAMGLRFFEEYGASVDHGHIAPRDGLQSLRISMFMWEMKVRRVLIVYQAVVPGHAEAIKARLAGLKDLATKYLAIQDNGGVTRKTIANFVNDYKPRLEQVYELSLTEAPDWLRTR